MKKILVIIMILMTNCTQILGSWLTKPEPISIGSPEWKINAEKSTERYVEYKGGLFVKPIIVKYQDIINTFEDINSFSSDQNIKNTLQDQLLHAAGFLFSPKNLEKYGIKYAYKKTLNYVIPDYYADILNDMVNNHKFALKKPLKDDSIYDRWLIYDAKGKRVVIYKGTAFPLAQRFTNVMVEAALNTIDKTLAGTAVHNKNELIAVKNQLQKAWNYLSDEKNIPAIFPVPDYSTSDYYARILDHILIKGNYTLYKPSYVKKISLALGLAGLIGLAYMYHDVIKDYAKSVFNHLLGEEKVRTFIKSCEYFPTRKELYDACIMFQKAITEYDFGFSLESLD